MPPTPETCARQAGRLAGSPGMEEGCGGAGRVAAKEGGVGRAVWARAARARGHALEVLKVSNFLTGGECIGAWGDGKSNPSGFHSRHPQGSAENPASPTWLSWGRLWTICRPLLQSKTYSWNQEFLQCPDPWADPKTGSAVGFYNLQHRSIRIHNSGFHFSDPSSGLGG